MPAFRPFFALAALALATACATPAYVSPVEVTRFVGDAPAYLGQGTISIVAAAGEEENLTFSLYRDAVRRELENLGYRVVAQDGKQVARMSYERFQVNESGRRSPVGVGVGGSTGTYGSGIGVGVGIDLSRLGRKASTIETRIGVSIVPMQGGQNLWEGRAAMTATDNSDYAGTAQAAGRLAEALFRDFPGSSGETIIVE